MNPDPFPVLETARCLLVQPGRTHAPAMLEIFGNEETTRYLQSPPAEDLAACCRKLEGWQRDFEAGKGFHWVVLPRENPHAPAGFFALHYWSQVHRRAELGSYLRRDWWGRGLSTELTQAVLAFAFRRLALHRVELRCDPRNAASTAIAQKLGMRLEGVLRGFVFVEGKGFLDEAVYALLRSEWQG